MYSILNNIYNKSGPSRYVFFSILEATWFESGLYIFVSFSDTLEKAQNF